MREQIHLDARPGPVVLDPTGTAVIVVDMQNDFGSEGGMFHRAGIDISGIQEAVRQTSKVLAAARQVEIPIVYLKMAYRTDLSDLGEADAPNRVRHLQIFGVGEKVEKPGGGETRVLIRNEWGTEVVDALKPQAGDAVIYKSRFSGFYETELDSVLKRNGTRRLLVAGCTTSVCVESTIRDAFFRDYHCVLLEDCASEPIGRDAPRSNHQATVLLIETLFGWISTTEQFLKAVEALHMPAKAPAE